MKIVELKKLARAKLNSGLSKQEAFEFIVSMNVCRIHDVADAIRDIASGYYKKKFKQHNLLLTFLILLTGAIQGLNSIWFSPKDFSQTLPADIFLFLTYIVIAIGILKYYKLSFSAVIFLSLISIYISIQNIIASKNESSTILYFGLITLFSLSIIALSSILYSKYFRGYDLKTGEDKRESYIFKEEK